MIRKLHNSGIKILEIVTDYMNGVIGLAVDGNEMTEEQLKSMNNTINEERNYIVDVTIRLQNKPIQNYNNHANH